MYQSLTLAKMRKAVDAASMVVNAIMIDIATDFSASNILDFRDIHDRRADESAMKRGLRCSQSHFIHSSWAVEGCITNLHLRSTLWDGARD